MSRNRDRSRMHSKNHNTLAVVPCYNEEKGIAYLENQLDKVVSKLKKDYQVELIFVDDGSTDNTNSLLHKEYSKNKEVKIIKHKKNIINKS